MRTGLRVPVVTKIVGEVNATWPWRPDIKEAVLHYSAAPCLDVYDATAPEVEGGSCSATVSLAPRLAFLAAAGGFAKPQAA